MKLVAIIVVAIIFIILLFIFIKLLFKLISGEAKNNKITQQEIIQQTVLTIRDILKLATNNELSRNELFTLCNEFIKIPFPPKQGQEISSVAKEHLDFIIFIASHKNADAKLISHLNNEAKKKNPSYASQIEEYEKTGLEQRKNRR